jgi:tyrosyl-tRNA synthetase
VEYNPVMEICKYIVFREKKTFTIDRPAKYGGKVEFTSLKELAYAYGSGKLHPADLKNGVAEAIVEILEPVRRYFANNREAMECLNVVTKAQVTR